MTAAFPRWAPWPMLLVTWIAFAQVVSFQGLAIWIAAGSIATAVVVDLASTISHRALPLVAMAVMTVGVPALAEWVGGNSAGPITRASLMACAAAGAMAVVVRTRYPHAIVPIALVLLIGALGLGAASLVPWIVGLWVVAAGLAITMAGPLRRDDLADPGRRRAFAFLLIGAGLVAVLALTTLAPFLRSPWTIPGAGTVAVGAAAPASLAPAALAPVASAPDDASAMPTPPSATPSAAQPVAADEDPTLSWIVVVLLIALVLILLALVVALLRRGWAALRWWQLHRRLASGTPVQRAIGAWTWVRLRRARHDMALPPHVSPDVAVVWARDAGEPDVLAVATVAAAAAYGTSDRLMGSDADHAWASARNADPYVPWKTRWRHAARTPRRVVREGNTNQ